MKKDLKTALSNGVTTVLNHVLASSANASSSFYLNQPEEPAALKQFKKVK